MQTFLKTYKKLSADRLDLLAVIYTQDVRFVDPIHKIHGIQRLTDYFEGLYQQIEFIHFDFLHHLKSGTHGYVRWEMALSHPRLKRGDTIKVPGASYLCFHHSGKVFFHQDYFDLGAMLYEHLPLLSQIISALKRRLTS